jgi:O-acetyl-ADP-ribose deacetylase (regulator of RNase III)
MSTAIYGFPNEEAALVALNAVKQWLQRDNNKEKVPSCEQHCILEDFV